MTPADIIQILILVVLMVTAYIAIHEIKENRKIHEELLKWNIKNKTQDTLDELRKLTLPLLGNIFRGYLKNPGTSIPLKLMLEEIEKDNTVKAQIVQRLNSQEGLARGIFLKLYDEELVKQSRKTSMIQVFHEYKEYIEYRRKISNPNAWKNFEKIVEKWDNEENIS